MSIAVAAAVRVNQGTTPRTRYTYSRHTKSNYCWLLQVSFGRILRTGLDEIAARI